MRWHQLSGEMVIEALRTSRRGLGAGAVRGRLSEYGPNVLAEGKGRTSPWMFIDQFKDFMIIVLLAAAVVSGVIGEAKDAVAIMTIVVLNAVIGFIQEYRDGLSSPTRSPSAPNGTRSSHKGSCPTKPSSARSASPSCCSSRRFTCRR
jgi:Ca2+-transporting ATPase